MTARVGDTIKITRMGYCGYKEVQDYNGRTGKVCQIDGVGQLHGTWGGLSLIPDTDEFEIIS